MLVVPMITAPAAFNLETTSESSCATKLLKTGSPNYLL